MMSKAPIKPWLYGTLIALLLVWAIGTTLILADIIPVPKLLAGLLGPGSRSSAAGITEKAGGPPPSSAGGQFQKSPPVSAAVYRTSVVQLYQDYDANEVAIQSKIAGDPVRVSGSVAEIQEEGGHPVIILHTGATDAADMVLTDDQRPAAAQLAKEDSVEIQCNRMQRVQARLHGSDCTLVMVDAGAKLVYLTLAVSGRAGSSPFYVVGPMSRTLCMANGDSIAAELTGSSSGDRIRSKTCTATVSDNLAHDGCQLNSSIPALPDLPTARLWKYECSTTTAEAMPPPKTSPPPKPSAKPASSRGNSQRTAAAGPVMAVASVPLAAALSATSSAAAAPAEAAAVATPAPLVAATKQATAVGPAVVGPAVVGPAVPLQPAVAGPAVALQPAAVSSGAPAGSPASAGSMSSASIAGSPTTPVSAPAPTADELAPVRATDPQAAQQIVSYCGKITASATAERCRREEMDAWNRLTVQNEFPELDAGTRQKCTDPPFQDSFVALESCAKYQLHLD